MRVFHFVSTKHAISNIENSWLKVATIKELNDPYEFYANFTSSGKPLDICHLNKVIEIFNGIVGFLCFSKCRNNPVQWAHYADKHKGLCLEFEVPNKFLIEMKYRNRPIDIEVSDKNWRQQFEEATKNKFQHWKYEEEYRMAVDLNEQEVTRQSGLLFMPFSDHLKLCKVYSGVNCNLSADEKKVLDKNNIDLVATEMSRTSYSITKTKQGNSNQQIKSS